MPDAAPAPNQAPAPRDARFAVFAALYAAASVLDHAQMGTELGLGWGTLALLAALAVLFRPKSLAAFALLAFAQAAFFAGELPDTSNLGITHLFACCTLLAGILWRAFAGRGRATGGELLDSVAPALRLELVALYAWSCWHKLNADFFDPDISCAVALYEKVRTGLPFLPLPEGASIALLLAVSTLAIEGGLPLLLVPRRTRGIGVALGAAFHLLLGFGYFYAFSSAALALLFLFAPERLSERAARLGTPRNARRYRAASALLVAAIVAARVAYSWHADRALLANLAGVDTLGNQFFQRWWWLYVPLVACAAPSLFAPSSERARDLLLPRPRWLLAFPLVYFLNGASPYLGLKTESSFAMYSNLRTEGGATNHFLIEEPLDVFGYQADLVRVLDSSAPEIAALGRGGRPLPFIALRVSVHAALEHRGDLSLTFERGGVERSVPSVRADPELAVPPTWAERKLLSFREIQSSGCGH